MKKHKVTEKHICMTNIKKSCIKYIVTLVIMSILIANNGKFVDGAVQKKHKGNQIKKECVVWSKNKKLRKKISSKYTNKNCKYTALSNKKNIDTLYIEAQDVPKEKGIIAEPNIQFNANKNKIIYTSDISSDWNLKMINSNKQFDSNNNRKIKVAIIDSGIDYNEDLNVVERCNMVETEEGVLPLYDDFSGHGTSIASIIASSKKGIRGINPDVELYSIKIFDYENKTNLSKVVEAIYKAIEYNVDIISISFGTTEKSEILHRVILK